MTKYKFIPARRGIVVIASIMLALLSVGFISYTDDDTEYANNLNIFVTLFREVNLLYVDKIEPKKLIEAGINGMLESLDPYTTFIPAEDVDEFKFMTTGKYGGIGALIRKGGNYILITEPYEGFPAQKAGLHAGDSVLSIDGVSTKGKTVSDVSNMLKGTPNTPLTLKIKRIGSDSILIKTFVREEVAIPNVPYYGMIKDNIGYIMLSNFMAGAGKETKKAFEDLKAQGAKSVILDLRDNPGGLLNEAVEVANIWIPKDYEIVSTRGKDKEWDKSYITEHDPVDTAMPMIVLVSRGSASASEIVAGSLQDLDRAVILGQKTFGKGLVQTTRQLSFNTHLKVTTAKYYIPSGRCIQALDYTHRNPDGSVGYIPDSLISEFKTHNGRKVYDGGGIAPDIKIESDGPGNITVALYTQNLIFDFATVFASQHPTIDNPVKFQISDEIFNQFISFVKLRDFEYNTESSEKLNELIKTSKAEGYYDFVKQELEGLQGKLHGDKEKDLNTFSEEIKNIMADEIISRYYYQKGRIKANVATDKEVLKAVDILNSTNVTSKILFGKYDGETTFALGTKK